MAWIALPFVVDAIMKKKSKSKKGFIDYGKVKAGLKEAGETLLYGAPKSVLQKEYEQAQKEEEERKAYMIKLALIGGGTLLLIGVAYFVLKRRSAR